MNIDRRDDLDRTIDEVLTSATAGEPRRVNAASVRQAMGESRRPGLPVWFAVAAVLLVGLALALTSLTRVESQPERVASKAEVLVPGLVRPILSPEPVQAASMPIRRTAKSPAVDTESDVDAPWEGLPRLSIATIDLPEPLSTGFLEADPIQIPRIEIPPLSVSTLANEQKQN